MMSAALQVMRPIEATSQRESPLVGSVGKPGSKRPNTLICLLHGYARAGNAEKVQELIEQYHITPGQNSVTAAAYGGNKQLVAYLMDDLGVTASSKTVTHAAAGCHEAMIKYLVEEKGVSPNSSALSNVAGHGRLDLARYLKEKCGVQHNKDTLGCAVSGGMQLVKYFVEEQGVPADIWATFSAVKQKKMEAAQYFIEELDLFPRFDILLPAAGESNNLELVQYLCEKYFLKAEGYFGNENTVNSRIMGDESVDTKRSCLIQYDIQAAELAIIKTNNAQIKTYIRTFIFPRLQRLLDGSPLEITPPVKASKKSRITRAVNLIITHKSKKD